MGTEIETQALDQSREIIFQHALTLLLRRIIHVLLWQARLQNSGKSSEITCYNSRRGSRANTVEQICPEVRSTGYATSEPIDKRNVEALE